MLVFSYTLYIIKMNPIPPTFRENNYKYFLEVNPLNIELKERNKTKESFSKIGSKIEDILFSILLKIPEQMLPSFLTSRISSYLDKRTRQIEAESIKTTWTSIALENAIHEIHSRTQKEAPSED